MLRAAHCTAAGSTSEACSSRGPASAASAVPDRPGAAAQVDDDRRPSGAAGFAQEPRGLPDQELGAAAGHKDSGVHFDPQPAELRPAQDVLERQAGNPLLHEGVEVVRRRGGRGQQPGLLLGEDAAGRPEPRDDRGAEGAGGAVMPDPLPFIVPEISCYRNGRMAPRDMPSPRTQDWT